MKLRTSALAIRAFLRLAFLGTRTPLLVGWALTDRCNLRCRYCNTKDGASPELPTGRIKAIVDELAGLGCARIAFTGGEPLLRDDIGEIVSHSKHRGIYTGINTNGRLIPEKIDRIKDADLLMLSLDGPENVHDGLRGRGAYQGAIRALEIAREYGIKTAVTVVVTKQGIQHIDFILETARQFNSYAYFQPVTQLPLGAGDLRDLVPRQDEFKSAIKKLLEYKGRHYPVGNSAPALQYLLAWPRDAGIACKAGCISCAIDPAGYLYACSNLRKNMQPNIVDLGFKKAFDRLERVRCTTCWCASPLEINMLLSFRPASILNILKTQR